MEYTEADERRFWALVERRGPEECWPWKAHIDKAGYGKWECRRRTTGQTGSAHRFAYLFANAKWPGDLDVCHTCDYRACCNPAHLWLGTNQDNINDKVKKGRQYRMQGEAHHAAKLNDELVRQMRTETMKQMDIAVKYGVSQAIVSKVMRGESWTHVK